MKTVGAVGGEQLLAMLKSARSVGWDWDLKTGRDLWFGDLPTLFGMQGDTYIGRPEDFHRFLHPEDRERVAQQVADARRHRSTYLSTFRVVWPDGTVRWIEANGRFSYGADGEAMRMAGVAADITERRLISQQLAESERRLQVTLDSAPLMVWMAGHDRLRHYFNRGWLEFTGRSLETESGGGWTDGVHPDDLSRCMVTYARSFEGREPFSIEFRLRRHDGEYRWVLDNGVPRFEADGTFAGYVGSAVDVTKQKHAEQELASLSRKLLEALEQERTRIARELHDDFAQRITLMAIDLDGLKTVIGPDLQLQARVQLLYDRVVDMARDLQMVSHHLHSSKLEYVGLASAAAAFCNELSAQHGVTVDFSQDGVPRDLPRDTALGLFRVLQGALTNAVKHSGVRRFKVSLSVEEGRIALQVVDAGVGFDVDAGLRSNGLGLLSMRERLNLLHGELSISSAPDRGTQVQVRVPFDASPRQAWS